MNENSDLQSACDYVYDLFKKRVDRFKTDSYNKPRFNKSLVIRIDTDDLGILQMDVKIESEESIKVFIYETDLTSLTEIGAITWNKYATKSVLTAGDIRPVLLYLKHEQLINALVNFYRNPLLMFEKYVQATTLCPFCRNKPGNSEYPYGLDCGKAWGFPTTLTESRSFTTRTIEQTSLF